MKRPDTQKGGRRRGAGLDLMGRVRARIKRGGAGRVWTPNDFARLAPRAAVDKALQRLHHAGDIRRIDRGLYDVPRENPLTGKASNPDYTAVIEAVARRDKARIVPDGIAAANQLGLTDAVPGRVIVHTDARLRPIRLGQLTISFRLTAPSRLYWAGRPAMLVVQALHWLRDMAPAGNARIFGRIRRLVCDSPQGEAIRRDLEKGFDALPAWMHEPIRSILKKENETRKRTAKKKS